MRVVTKRKVRQALRCVKCLPQSVEDGTGCTVGWLWGLGRAGELIMVEWISSPCWVVAILLI